MRIYLDDDHIDPLLVKLLRRDGHDVVTPADFGLAGAADPVHLTAAVREGRALLTGNHADFRYLHTLLATAGGHHPGILVVRKDNDKSRDLTPSGIARAVADIEASGVELRDDLVIVNQWR